MTVAVVDASVWCDALLPGDRKRAARDALDPYATLAAPEHLRLEIVQVLRRHARSDLDSAQVAATIGVVRQLPLAVVPTAELLERIWELRDQLTAYDAAYAAAAERLDAPLLTGDKGLLAQANRLRCAVIDPLSDR
ncbi:MAG: type II toxin-antitoxin system VapC family toxin [Thermocrispum sp.]